MDAVTIPARFNGPPASSNGGYACGVCAALLGTAVAEVSLRQPPPLERPLRVETGSGEVELCDADRVVVEAHGLEELDLEVPEPLSVAAAEQASRAYPWYDDHPFPTCFVCGPERTAGDGLRIFAGAVEGRDELFACEWTPAPDLADEGGQTRPEIVWAALDCPSAVAAAPPAAEPAGPAVLARLTASLEAPVRADEPHVVLSWPLGRSGRKREAGSALLGPDGGVRARARALWVELRGQ
jgi:hypothetical protein